MFNKWLGTIIFILLLFCNNYYASADEIEVSFKDTCIQMAKEWGKIPNEASKVVNSDLIGFESNLTKWKSQLKELINTNPKSIWADDAQYIIASLNAGNFKQEMLEYEYLLKNYSDMHIHIEDWTQETLVGILSKPKDMTFEEGARFFLCFDYKYLGEMEKLKNICEESVKKYPNNAKIFERFLQSATSASK